MLRKSQSKPDADSQNYQNCCQKKASPSNMRCAPRNGLLVNVRQPCHESWGKTSSARAASRGKGPHPGKTKLFEMTNSLGHHCEMPHQRPPRMRGYSAGAIA